MSVLQMSKDNPRIKELLSAQEAADLINQSVANIYFWMDNNKLRVVSRGTHKLVYRKEVEGLRKS